MLNFTFEPSVYLMGQITNWSSLVSTTLPISKIQHEFICPDLAKFGRCNLTLTVYYTQTIEHNVYSIYLNFSNYPRIKYNSRLLYFIPEGQIAELTYEPDGHLNMLSTIEVIMFILVVMSLLIFLASIYFEKMVGVELITTVQYVYYLLTPINHNPIELVPF